MKIDRNYIAKQAGVSTATVSRAFNDPRLVAPDKVEAIMAAAKKYGYSPNKMASALRRRGTGGIAFLDNSMNVSGLDERKYFWSFGGCRWS